MIEISDVQAGRKKEICSALQKLAADMRPQVRYRLQNSLDNFERAIELIDNDLEMASFRAITGEEEAASCLIYAIKLRGYAGSKSIRPNNHVHKNAVIVCVLAIGVELTTLLKNFQLVFDYRTKRIDLKIPLETFGVEGGEGHAIQFAEPLDVLHSRQGFAEEDVFLDALTNFSKNSQFDGIKKLVSYRANQRNTLLYASDQAVPSSKTTLEVICNRRDRAIALLVISIMVLQSKKKLATVRKAIAAISSVIGRLPEK